MMLIVNYSIHLYYTSMRLPLEYIHGFDQFLFKPVGLLICIIIIMLVTATTA
jgi:hypothetical protein